MDNRNKLILGTRGSKLALIQTNLVADALKIQNSSLQIEIKIIQTKGDVNQSPIPLDTIGKNWFTGEIEQALLKKEIDLAVHSLKDVAPEIPDGLTAMPVLTREDPREALITKTGARLADLKKGAIIGTDSVRRKAQLLHARPDFNVMSVRGNVDTRLRKLHDDNNEQHYDAIVLAVAGLKRLGLLGSITEILDPELFVPAPGQGVLAAQIRSDDGQLLEMIANIQDESTKQIVEAEQTFTRTIGGGCKLPIGCIATIENNSMKITGMMAETNGSKIEYISTSGIKTDAAARAQVLANNLLTRFEKHA